MKTTQRRNKNISKFKDQVSTRYINYGTVHCVISNVFTLSNSVNSASLFLSKGNKEAKLKKKTLQISLRKIFYNYIGELIR